MILYGSSMSPFVRKVLAYAAERRIAMESRPIRIADPDPEFRKASPFGKMPALVDGDFRLSDSSAIIHYLEAKFPDGPLIPSEPRSRGRVVWWEEFADTILMACLQKLFFNRVVAPLFLQREGNLAAAAAAEREELPPLLRFLEDSAPVDGFLVGEALTLADLAVASPLANLEHMGMAIEASSYPKLAAYTRRMLERPSFAESLIRERQFMKKVAA